MPRASHKWRKLMLRVLAAGKAARQRAEHARARVNFIEGDAVKLPFADGTFDIVIAVTVLCFVPMPRVRFGRWPASSFPVVASSSES